MAASSDSISSRQRHYNELIRPESQTLSIPLSPNLSFLKEILKSVLPKVFQGRDTCDFFGPGIFHHRHVRSGYVAAFTNLKKKLSSQDASCSESQSSCKQFVLAQLEGFQQALTAMGQRYDAHEKALKNVITRMKLASGLVNLPVKEGYVHSQITNRIKEFHSYLVQIQSLMNKIAKDEKIIQNLMFDFAPIAKLVGQTDPKQLPTILRFPNLFEAGEYTISRETPGWRNELKLISKFYRGFGKDPNDPEPSYKYSGYIQLIEDNREYLEHWMTNLGILKNLFSFVIQSLENEKKKQSLFLPGPIENLTALEFPLLPEDHFFNVMETGASPDFEQFLKNEASYIRGCLSEVPRWIWDVKKCIGQFNTVISHINKDDYPGRLFLKVQDFFPPIDSAYCTLVTRTEKMSMLLDVVIAASCHFDPFQNAKENDEGVLAIKSLSGEPEFLLDPNSSMYQENLKALIDFQKKYHPFFETMTQVLQPAYDSMYLIQCRMIQVCKACLQHLDKSKKLDFDEGRLGRLKPKATAKAGSLA
jgi:hypothetical protein